MLGPSSAYKWTACPGSIALEQVGGYKDSAGSAARVGTFQHHVAAICLDQDLPAKDFIGYKETVEGEDFEFDTDMAVTVQTYLDTVRNYVGHDGILFIEQELDISWITGEANAIGTADAIVARDGELTVIDLKTGRNNVDAKENDQLLMYAAAALKAYNEGKLTAPVKSESKFGPYYWLDGASGTYGSLPTLADVEVLQRHEPLVNLITKEEYDALVADAALADLL